MIVIHPFEIVVSTYLDTYVWLFIMYIHVNLYKVEITNLKWRYSLRPILLFTNADVSITKMCLDTSILAKSIMGRRE
jgi:hypothetical protein